MALEIGEIMYRIILSMTMAGLLALVGWGQALAGSSRFLSGPVEAYVEKVIDGDTLRVRAKIWIDQEIRVLVRVKGVDTPELRRPRCHKERELARKAKSLTFATVANRRVRLSNIHRGKYAGRVVADVTTEDGVNLAHKLLASGQAKPYRRRRYQGWCTIKSDVKVIPTRQSFLMP